MTVKKLVKQLKIDLTEAERKIGALDIEYCEASWERKLDIENEAQYYEDKISVIKKILEYIEKEP